MKLVLCYKNFAAQRGISHIGLGVAALNTAKCLKRAGYDVDVWPITSAADLRAKLGKASVTHVVISAPWISTPELLGLTAEFSSIEFAVNCHSNVGFLQADVNGTRLFGSGMEIERATLNFRIAANSRRLKGWAEETFDVPCTWLPNLYFVDGHVPADRPIFRNGVLRIGAFGATRPLKNLMSGAAAALTIGRQLDVDLEVYVNSGRDEGGSGIRKAITELFALSRSAKLVEAGWSSWHNHRKLVSNMDLLISTSYTESFNMVTADGIAEGVASVVSDAIDWVPRSWQACADDVCDIARVGRALLFDPKTGRNGLRALEKHNREGLGAWREFLNGR